MNPSLIAIGNCANPASQPSSSRVLSFFLGNQFNRWIICVVLRKISHKRSKNKGTDLKKICCMYYRICDFNYILQAFFSTSIPLATHLPLTKILSSCANSDGLLTRKSLLISKFKPSLNKQGSSVPFSFSNSRPHSHFLVFCVCL